MKRGQHVIVTNEDLTEARAEFISSQWLSNAEVATVRLFEPWRSSVTDGGLRMVPMGCIEGADMELKK